MVGLRTNIASFMLPNQVARSSDYKAGFAMVNFSSQLDMPLPRYENDRSQEIMKAGRESEPNNLFSIPRSPHCFSFAPGA